LLNSCAGMVLNLTHPLYGSSVRLDGAEEAVLKVFRQNLHRNPSQASVQALVFARGVGQAHVNYVMYLRDVLKYFT